MEFTGSRVAFHLFGIPVYWYAILIVTGMVIGVWLCTKEAQRRGYSEELIQDLALWVLPAAIIGARIYYVIFEWERYADDLIKIFDIRGGGMAIHGGIIGALIAGYFFCRKRKVSMIELMDIAFPALALAQGIGRWGNFINNEAHGGPTDLPWAIIVNGQKVHPTFLYESIGDILIFLFLWFYLRKRQRYDGQLSMWYFILYGILRFFVEGLRTDSLYWGPIRMAQAVSLVGIAIGIVGLFYFKKRGKLSKGAQKANAKAGEETE